MLIIGLITGILIGTVGIGGILLSPLLTYIMGMDLHLAMSTSSWSFLFTGIVGTIAYARKGTVSWGMVPWLSLGIVPATLLGAWTNTILPTNSLTVVLALLITFSGLNALYRQSISHQNPIQLSYKQLISVGLVVGFGSALTGTGGPVLLVPIFIFLNIPALVAIGVSQVIQLPIAVFAATGFALYGHIDFNLGTMLGLVQAVGVLMGAKIAHSVPPQRLRQLVAIALLGTGGFMGGRALGFF